jgi:hypothetical protein
MKKTELLEGNCLGGLWNGREEQAAKPLLFGMRFLGVEDLPLDSFLQMMFLFLFEKQLKQYFGELHYQGQPTNPM